MAAAPEVKIDTDVVVVGSGPGGATVARELARAGRRVVLLERGRDYRQTPIYGTYLGALRYSDRASLRFTHEGLQIVRPLMLGGATSMYCGCAAPPPDWLQQRYGIDITAETAQASAELEIAPLAEELRGAASTRLAMAGRALGYDWQPQAKFLRPARSSHFNCGAHCMLGCRCGAKWSAAEYVDAAVAAGAQLYTQAQVTEVLRASREAIGVSGKLAGKPFQVKAATVVLAAGGIGTPRILQQSGLPYAGLGITMDTTLMVYGMTREPGIGNEPPMTWSWHNDAEGYMLSTLIDPWLLYPLITGLQHPRHILTWPRWGNMLGVMIKLKDDLTGGVRPNGSISKPLVDADRERLASARRVADRILVEAGADPQQLFATPLRGTHPSSTVRIGTLLDNDLQTEYNGLYVCDASVFPEALGRPTVLTIIGLGLRLARRLTGQTPAAVPLIEQRAP